VLLLSGSGEEDSRFESLAAAADGYMVKPVSRRELVARVERAIAAKRAVNCRLAA
jgi:DNA-binding response OmpR family regulator